MKIRYVSLRTKLIASFLAVIILGGVLSLSFGSKLVEDIIISQAQDTVKYDLQTAWILYNERLHSFEKAVLIHDGAGAGGSWEAVRRLEPMMRLNCR